jgi:hypothetical protein
MSTTAQDLETIDLQIDEAKKKIARKDMLIRLEQNPDFRELIQKGFLESHAIRQVMLKAHPGMQSEAAQKMLEQQITAIGGFKQFLIGVYVEGSNAETVLAEDEATREELLREGLSDD